LCSTRADGSPLEVWQGRSAGQDVINADLMTTGHYCGMAHRVLIADDDRAIRESLVRALELEGYQVAVVADGVAALATARRSPVDVLILDVMMPGVDGLGVCRVLRADGDLTPVLMLTARVETADRVAGLDAGADDYLPKPFELDELLARLRALLRRASPDAGDPASRALRLGELLVDPAARRVWWHAAEIDLSKTEFDLLELLVRNEGIVLDHTTIYQRIWGYDFGPDSKNLAVYISYLRRKLEKAGASALIHTVRGVGYSVRAS
jgi:two-component system response regulator MprA